MSRRTSLGVKALVNERVLWAAWARVACGTRQPGTDGVSTEGYVRRLSENLSALADLIRSGTYRPQPLRRIELKREGKIRQLALPTVRDRIAQRAFLEVYGRLLDAHQAEASFAYRKGQSWLDALSKCEQARDRGLRWVFRGDIEAFFDRINHTFLGE